MDMGAVRRHSDKGVQEGAARPSADDRVPEARLLVRRAVDADTADIVELLCLSLGWQPDERHRALFAWKHRDNPFGASPCWVAVDESGVVGVRIFMRWGFTWGADRAIEAVRAVDTATHPRARGLGIFRTLTLQAVDELKAQGLHWVFNTPNEQSLPGYLTMGWQRLGHLPVALRPSSVRVMPRLASARVPAALWSAQTSAGEDAATVLADEELIELLASQRRGTAGLGTARSAAYLRWRYGTGPVEYRAMLAGSSLRDGVAFFRLRRRGPATEAAIVDLLLPGDDHGRAGPLGRRILKASGADYVIALGSDRPRGWLGLPRIGPLLTWRALAEADAPPIEQWELSAGDIELF